MTAPLLGMSLLLLVIGGFTAWFVHRAQQTASDLLSESIAQTRASQRLEFQLREIRSHLNDFAISDDAQYLRFADRTCRDVEASLAEVTRLEHTEATSAVLRQIQEQYVRFSGQFRDALAQSDSEFQRETIRNLRRNQLTQEILVVAREYREATEDNLQQVNQQNLSAADQISLALLLVVTCGAVSGLAAGVGVARGLNRSIAELNIPVHAAAGSLNEVVGPISVTTHGNIDDIRESMEGVAVRVAEAVEHLQATQRQSLRAEQFAAIGQLAAGLAHEIRNPLTAMRTVVQIARQQGGASALDDRDLQILEEEISRLNEHVQTFLDYARPPKLTRVRVDLNDLVQRTVQLTTARAEQQDISVITKLPAKSVTVSADRAFLQQVLLNLVLNAIDAQPNGGSIEIRVTAPQSPQLRNEALMEVLDRGTGIAEDVMERIFDPFFSTKESGTGIGLAISRRILEELGGTIGARNREDGGAAFSLSLRIGATETSHA
ncbi:MAG: hypothetical protein KDA89_04410 [Planctomycetaceae bacterium]|nr:hypothetical protein [Planctomycetaceae bacterium]